MNIIALEVKKCFETPLIIDSKEVR